MALRIERGAVGGGFLLRGGVVIGRGIEGCCEVTLSNSDNSSVSLNVS